MPDPGKAKVAGKTNVGKERQRAVMKCKKCGREGYRSDGCGTSHEPLGDSDEDEEREPIAALIARSSVGQALKEVREIGIDAHLAKLERPRHRPIAKPLADRVEPDSPEPDDEDDEPEPRTPWKPAEPVVRGPSCPHGNGSPASCSQCVLGAATVKRVAIVGGSVVVDGTALRSTREQEELGRAKHGRGRPRKAA